MAKIRFRSCPLRNFSYMKFILATKQHMTQIFDEKGVVHAGTVLVASPITVSQIRTIEKDGYEAVQIGSGARKEKNVGKALKGHLKDLPLLRTIKEFRGNTEGFARGDVVNVSIFNVGDIVQVSGVSKGKGFQGVVKRHGFHGGPRSHGQAHNERAPGAIGGGGGRAGGRVAKGIKMAGRMGSDRVTIKNLKVLVVDPESNTIVLSGAVPGRRGTVVEIVQK